jgi:hypothetical protein
MKTLLLFLFLSLMMISDVMAFGFISHDFRWRADDGDLTTATWLADENEQITLSDADVGQTIRLRISLSGESAFEPEDVGLFYSGSKATGYTLIDDNPDKAFMLTPSENVDDNTPITEGLLSNPNEGSFTEGRFLSETDRGFLDPGDSGYTELEFSLTPTENAVNGTYYIRIQHFRSGFNQGTYNNDIILVFESTNNAFAGGNGSEEQPYEVENWLHLNEIRNFMDSFFIQTANIDKTSAGYSELIADEQGNLANGGLGWVAIGFFEEIFAGTYDGGESYTISDLQMNQQDNINTGLFSKVGGTLKNVGLINANVRGPASAGGIAGRIDAGGTITDSYFTGTVQGGSGVGGLAGQNAGAVINSYTDASVRGNSRVGGLVGEILEESSITSSYAEGVVSGTGGVGGLAGFNDGLISNSYATAKINTRVDVSRVGGLVGTNSFFGQVTNSYSTGRIFATGINASLFGGLIGDNRDAEAENSYWNTESSEQAASGSGTGLTTAQMTQQSSFNSWDFSEVWAIDEGSSYPYLINNTRTPRPGPLPELTQQFNGTAGWRFISAPTRYNSYVDLLSTVWTQGYTGSKSNLADRFQNPDSNVLWYDEVAGRWEAPDHAANIAGSNEFIDTGHAGRGFIVYLYDALVPEGPTVWPKELTSAGEQVQGDVSLRLTRTESGDGPLPKGWHILGNPYSYPISWPQIVAANDAQKLFPVMFVFDNEMNEGAGGFRVNFGFDLNLPNKRGFDGTIEPFSAFQVRVLDGESEGNITFKESHAPAPVHRSTQKSESVPYLAFSVRGVGLEDMSVLTLRDDAEIAMERPSPIQLPAISFGFSDESQKQFVLKNLDMQQGDERLVPLSFASTQSGTFNIDLNGYEGWTSDVEVVLIDHETGAAHNFEAQGSYSFTYEPSAENMERRNVVSQMSVQQAVNQPEVLQLTAESRFELRLTKGSATSTEPARDLPANFALQQNYPNPFNPATQIQYQLPQASDVRLEVYNMQGQRVAVLADGPQNAGQHSVAFDASNLASGVYIYRLQAGSYTESKKMTLIK